jgi:hypothetical protein
MKTKTRKLFENTQKELLITECGNEITVKTKQDLVDDELLKQQKQWLVEHLTLMSLSFVAGMCIMYLILN